jgi:hypothetical protein
MTLVSVLVKVLSLGVIVLVVQYVVAYLKSPLKKIPGPFLAKFSDIWRFYNHYGQTHIETQKKLHEKYGDVVRLGPNTVSVTDPNLLKTIYSTRGTFLKVRAIHYQRGFYADRSVERLLQRYWSVDAVG